MEILLDDDTLKFFHEVLINLYKNTEDPISLGYSESMIQVSIERPLTDIYNIIPFPHILHKATILMETIINFHPFVDGNKRVALLATYFFLYWNGYNLTIPEDAADFTIEIAKGKHNSNSIFSWLSRNSMRSFGSVFRNKLFTVYLWLCGLNPYFELILTLLFIDVIFSPYPFLFFTHLIAKKAKKRRIQKGL